MHYSSSLVLLVPAQIVLLHSVVSVLFPKLEQSSPKGPGGGFVQERVLVRLPTPHIAEHGDQSLHWE